MWAENETSFYDAALLNAGLPVVLITLAR